MRKAISVTLNEDNLLWLRGQAARTSKGSVSELLDRLVGEARRSGRTDPAAVRSVAGTIDLPQDDPGLDEADAYLRSVFAASSSAPMVMREPRARPKARRKSRG